MCLGIHTSPSHSEEPKWLCEPVRRTLRNDIPGTEISAITNRIYKELWRQTFIYTYIYQLLLILIAILDQAALTT